MTHTPIPQPTVGMVVNYEYLWARQYHDGRTEGEKIRPCAILAVIEGKDETTVYVAPMTHTAPFHPEESIQLTDATSRRLRMNCGSSWLMVNEVNKFIWPGCDIRRVPNREPRTYCFGRLPEEVLLEARQKLKEFNQKKTLLFVPRDDPYSRPTMRAG